MARSKTAQQSVQNRKKSDLKSDFFEKKSIPVVFLVFVPQNISYYTYYYLVDPGVEVHDEVLGLGVPVPHLALVAIRVPRHTLCAVSVLAKLNR
jgi:hypothetical protein